ncbi:MAG: djlA [Gammaproteobacteria bacterium]|jgi:DnaJ like chaperone protein|nr:djlA [Gammaproteobacteria bacterium]
MIGKFICGLIGLMLAGPFGLIIGIMIGHFFDRGLAQHLRAGGAFGTQNTEAQQAFFKATFQVMGYIAKSDGVVTQEEIEQARLIMRQLNLNESQKQAAIEAFNEGKQADFNLDAAVNKLINKCRGQRLLLQLFLEFQIRAATIHGQLDAGKERIITRLSEQLGFLKQNTFNFEQFFRSFNEYAQQGGHQGFHGQGGNPFKNQMSLDSAYQTLEITSAASDEEIKKAYRKLISQNHPDKLVSKGLPPEMIKLATEKTQQIQLAYERICAARGIK